MERNIFFTDYMMAGWYQCFGAAAGALQELSKAKRKKNEKNNRGYNTTVLDIRDFGIVVDSALYFFKNSVCFEMVGCLGARKICATF